ncbi:unnamed protein product [Gulo gulo]|uniref:Uncharacterized protein n=1 Tax=Gulo gulo TaxID=48420 RepID=A0A9X9PY47_GULGU|nr:unnamed protein product [Gulo gulo]
MPLVPALPGACRNWEKRRAEGLNLGRLFWKGFHLPSTLPPVSKRLLMLYSGIETVQNGPMEFDETFSYCSVELMSVNVSFH